MKETYTSVVIELRERVKNLIESNSIQHKGIIDKVSTLCEHVNEENEKMDKRVKYLEDRDLIGRTQWKTLVFIACTTAGVTAFIIEIVNILLG